MSIIARLNWFPIQLASSLDGSTLEQLRAEEEDPICVCVCECAQACVWERERVMSVCERV